MMATHKLGKFSNLDEEEEEEAAAAHQQRQCHIPHDLMMDHILTRLPIKSLFRFKSVSKLWYSAISSPQFATAYFKLCPFSCPSSPIQCLFIKSGHDFYLFCCDEDDDGIVSDYGIEGLVKAHCGSYQWLDDLSLVGSCNGLICLASLSGYFMIWNPITHQFHKIPDPYLPISSEAHTISWGFRHVSSIDDYKIVRITEMSDILKITAHVFSLRTGKWKSVDNELFGHTFSMGMTSEHPISSLTHRGVLVRETIYWIAAYTEVPRRRIIAFDLIHEIFEEFHHLDLEPSDDHKEDFLSVMGGCLCRCSSSSGGSLDITLWRQPYGEEESISLSRNLGTRFCKDLVGFTRTGKIFGMDRFRKKLGLVDPSSLPMKYTPLISFQVGWYGEVQIVSCIPTVISPFANSALPEE